MYNYSVSFLSTMKQRRYTVLLKTIFLKVYARKTRASLGITPKKPEVTFLVLVFIAKDTYFSTKHPRAGIFYRVQTCIKITNFLTRVQASEFNPVKIKCHGLIS
jgi:hypothetical protein